MTDDGASVGFPEDLAGHYWAQLERTEPKGRWRFAVLDYQNNVLLTGLATSEQQAARIVRAWDQIIVSEFEGSEDPSID
ncbi:hypothetical protein [Angustibacter luteus]|uniref:DUF1508 domain-containing protein n=1 Tax=Angustibacter luteus TaxID=658456 RepID=A0ABW1JCC4_9ACTN